VGLPRGGALLALVVGAAACGGRARRARAMTEASGPVRALAGMYWGRLGEVPEGMRVQVWLDADGTRVRGAYSAVPWNGEIEGRVVARDEVALRFIERGVTRAVGARTRDVALRWDAGGSVLAGIDVEGRRVELVRAGFPPPTLRPGTWMAHWTGLSPGLAVETRLTQTPDGHWRAVYQYQGSGGVRDGSFDGVSEPGGVLAITWTEVAEGGTVERGRGRLAPAPFGLRGTYGIEGSAEGTGEWALEPLGP
jgi:hypothetical protein